MTSPKHSHQITKRTDPDGQVVVGVFLPNVEDVAWLYERDYLAIVAEHGVTSWYVNGNGRGSRSVRFNPPGGGRTTTVARLVAGDWPRTAVHVVDGNPFNLRSLNLRHRDGAGGCPKRTRRSAKVAPIADQPRQPSA